VKKQKQKMNKIGVVLKMLKSYGSFIVFFIAASFSNVAADRGMLPIIPGISVYEPGQKAIIAWSGSKEILILSTDVYADESTKVLEVLPLPSKPVVKDGNFKSFEVVQKIHIALPVLMLPIGIVLQHF